VPDIPTFLWLVLAGGLAFLGVHGLRGLLAIHEALQDLDLDRLAPPPNWPATRALGGVLAAMPVVLITRSLGTAALLSGFAVALLGFCAAPRFLAGARQRLRRQLLDEFSLHFDLLAVALESGASWSSALALCVERAPEGPLRRAWQLVLRDIQGGSEPLDALRALDQRLRLQPMTTLVSALRAAEKLRLPAADVLRDRARHCAAARFARAERQARAAPLKLWAAMLLCLAPCSVVVLAYPLSQLLALLSG
jgi:tight adherence protein C